MILAVSRFRVKNGMEPEVRAAFVNRPRLVERCPGFLGLETFTDSKDPALFYLVTRWTDEHSFRAWHRSEEHHLSHRGIPRGLKLDASFTEVVVLDRISDPIGGPTWEEHAADSSPLLALQLSRSSLVHFIVAGLDGTVRSCNQAVLNNLKLQESAVVGLSLWRHLTDRDAAALRQQLQEPRRGDDTLLLNFVDATHSPYTVQCHLDRRPDSFVLIGEPVSERRLQEELLHLNNQLTVLNRENVRRGKQAETALAEAEAARAQVADLLERITDGFVLLDRDWRFAGINRAAARVLTQLSRDPQRLIGRGIWDEFPEMVGTVTHQELLRAAAEQVDVEFEFHYPPLSRWYRCRAYPTRDGLSVFYHDITTQKRAEAALRERAEALTAEARRKDDFLAMLAHELRNPLGAVGNALKVMSLAQPDSPEYARAREVAARQVQHQSRLVDDLLDVSRIQLGKIELRREPLSLAQVVRHTVEDQRNALEAAGLTLSAEVPDQAMPVLGDRTRLVQIVGNLLHNAGKFTPPGGRVTIRLACNPAAGQAELTVADTGMGIAPELLPRLFDPFTQAETSLDRSGGGLGLGLALVKGLARLHGGTVRAESDGLGRGSRFMVTLPLTADQVVAEEPAVSNARQRRLRVLVIEDIEDAAETLRDLLELWGHEADVALSAIDGLETARRIRPDAVLCDIGLPGISGYEVAAQLRADPATASTRLIALTGYGAPDDRRRSHEAGFDLHLTKPVVPEELQKALGEIGSTLGSGT